MTDEKTDLVPFFALWREESASGRVYYSGNLGDGRIVMFPNDDKRSDRAPDMRAYLAPRRRREGDNGNG